MRRPTRWIALTALALACEQTPDPGADASPPSPPSTTAPPDAATRYAAMCASCHGEVGEGGLGPRLIDTPRTTAQLTAAIDQRMPPSNPSQCRGECASSLAAYIQREFTTAALACDVIPPSPRRLRLLTRREFRNTVRDLFGLSGSTPVVAPPADCNTARFAYDAGARTLRTVHLAGSFNGWSPTATPLTRDASANRWTASLALANGTWQYKFVLDGSEWVRDPANTNTASDGFGGQNSVLTVRCETTPTVPSSQPTLGFDPSAMLPVETRPQGFAYDNSAESAVVTSVHANEALRVSAAIVDALAPSLRTAVGCAALDAPACADRVVQGFGRRAFRRPLTENEAQRYRALVMNAPSVDAGVKRAVRAMLVSPSFWYRSEMGEAQADGTYTLTSWEVASALSYTFWGTMPDDALLDLAARNGLDNNAAIERESRRLLADPRAREQVETFAAQWLGVESVTSTPRNAAMFPGFGDDVRAAMVAESQRLVSWVIFDGSHRFGDLFTAGESFLNEPLARWYGVDGVTGAELRRVPLPAARRGGLLAHGSVMTRYAHSDQSSPILRGVFVRRALLCQEFPPPPPNAGGVPDVDPRATTRQRFAQHSSNAACASCHTHIDGVGFGFEQFDATGRLRDTEAGQPIDHAGAIDDVEGFGTGASRTFTSPAELGAVVAGSANARGCFARQWYRFARGYHETAANRCAVRALARRLDGDADVRDLLVGVALSPDFLHRR